MDNPLFGPRDGHAGDLLGDTPRIGYPQTGPQVSSADVKVDLKKTRQIKGWTIEIGEATEEEVAKEQFNKTWSEYKGSAKYVEPNSQGYAVVEVLNFLIGMAIDLLTLREEEKDEKLAKLRLEVECYEERDDMIDEDAYALAERALALPHNEDGTPSAYQRYPRARHLADVIRAHRRVIANLEAKLKD